LFGVSLRIPYRVSLTLQTIDQTPAARGRPAGATTFVYQLLNIALKRERGGTEDDDLIVGNHALPANSSTVSHRLIFFHIVFLL